MTVTKKMLSEYCDMQAYVKELRRKTERLAHEIDKLEERIAEIKNNGTVIDSVSGGYGGTQHYVIEGVPTKEYYEKKNRLALKKNSYEVLSPMLKKEEEKYHTMTCEVEKFITGIDDVYIKRIINLRFIENLSWNEVADCIGGGNTDMSVRQAFHRYMGD